MKNDQKTEKSPVYKGKSVFVCTLTTQPLAQFTFVGDQFPSQMSQVTVANMCKKHGSTISTITCTLVDVESMPSPMVNKAPNELNQKWVTSKADQLLVNYCSDNSLVGDYYYSHRDQVVKHDAQWPRSINILIDFYFDIFLVSFRCLERFFRGIFSVSLQYLNWFLFRYLFVVF